MLTLLLSSNDVEDGGGEDHQSSREFITKKPELWKVSTKYIILMDACAVVDW